jgi:hypothetical protein
VKRRGKRKKTANYRNGKMIIKRNKKPKKRKSNKENSICVEVRFIKANDEWMEKKIYKFKV